MIKYTISGALIAGVDWEDFITESEKHPNASIYAEPRNVPEGEEFVFEPSATGWYDVCVKVLNKETATKVLAAINGVSVSDIEIEEKGLVISV